MYEVTIQQHFDAAHALRGYDGRCENLHGHRYQVAVCLASGELNDIGLAFDFTELKALLQEQVLSRLDHTNLNETPPFDQINPSAENIARFVYERLTAALPQAHIRWVRVWESPDAWATYYPD
ncbi:MAG: 6-carboxytetrahydropterin synthase QueD [Chloroflexota bacterium]|nr:6-carboxytetrahydropterin synthase QueD [Chloroflexota bacterium]